MMITKHPYLFCGTFDENPLYYLFFSESGEFDDGFVYPIKAQIVPLKFEDGPNDPVGSKRKIELLTFIANINIILSYRHNKWFKENINTPASLESKSVVHYKIFWNRDNIEILEDLGEHAEAIDRLFAKKGEILKRLKISQEEYDKYYPLAREYVMYLRKRHMEDKTKIHERFYDLEMARYLSSFYIYNENGHPLIDRYVKDHHKMSKYPHYLHYFFQDGLYYPSYEAWAIPSRRLGIPESLIIEKYIEYANKHTPPELEPFKMIAFEEMRKWGAYLKVIN
ncbi:hypothetical protein [Sulfurihydrogenibium sp.]|jgi:hypothetical protein|uniref:hypothetical protein n=1 Tax=Sulfurihydrogenibium sp. TaxID=2053621 RepID=UPI002601F426|nr:hypothetical protein [Sulfurihydrogenibium sp.]